MYTASTRPSPAPPIPPPTSATSSAGKRTDLFGHSYFTSNPRVSSDLIQLIRYGKGPGDPGRDLIKTGRVTWRFPLAGEHP